MTDRLAEKLLPCRWCEPEEADLLSVRVAPGAGYNVHCPHCGCKGPWGNTAEEAAALWNEPRATRLEAEQWRPPDAMKNLLARAAGIVGMAPGDNSKLWRELCEAAGVRQPPEERT